MYRFLSTSKPSEINDRFDENSFVSDVGTFSCQFGQRAEERAAAGDVHLADWFLKRGGADVGSESVDDVLPVILV